MIAVSILYSNDNMVYLYGDNNILWYNILNNGCVIDGFVINR